MKNKKIILAVILILSSVIFSGCQKEGNSQESLTSMIPEITETNNEIRKDEDIITFADPVIESYTRNILNNPGDVITKEEVLSIIDFEISSESITTLDDLKYFKNLASLYLFDCQLNSLSGIEELKSLQSLTLRRNNITNLNPICGLTNLVSLDFAENDTSDYTALSALYNLEHLNIGNNGSAYTDLTPLQNLTKLKSLYAPWCGIKDISILQNMTELTYLQLFHNNVSDISVLSNLTKLEYLELGINKIEDISPLENLLCLTHINLQDNLIPEDILEAYYKPKASDYFTTVFHEKINPKMPEFTFELLAYFDRTSGSYSLEKLIITELTTGNIIQEILIPELASDGRTYVSRYDKETMGFKLEDLNFDGYQDIRLFDTPAGNYRMEWIYLVWNPTKNIFENDARLNEITLAGFDQDEQLIYGTERGSAADHRYSTYKYIDGEPTLIFSYSQNYIRSGANIETYFAAADISTTETDIIGFHEVVSELNDTTGKMEITRDEYVFYTNSDALDKDAVIARFDTSSKIGKMISADN